MMKWLSRRRCLVFALVLPFGWISNGQDSQPDQSAAPDTPGLQQQYDQIRERIEQIAGPLRVTEDAISIKDQPQFDPLLNEVGKAFDLRIQIQKAKLDQIEASLQSGRQRLSDRQQHRAEIIEKRVKDLLATPPEHRSPQAVIEAMCEAFQGSDFAIYLNLLTDDESERYAGMMLQTVSMLSAVMGIAQMSDAEGPDGMNLAKVHAALARHMHPNPPAESMKAYEELQGIYMVQMFSGMGVPSPETPIYQRTFDPESYSKLLRTASGVLRDVRAFNVDIINAMIEMGSAHSDMNQYKGPWTYEVDNDTAIATCASETGKPQQIELTRVHGKWLISKLVSDPDLLTLMGGPAFQACEVPTATDQRVPPPNVAEVPSAFSEPGSGYPYYSERGPRDFFYDPYGQPDQSPQVTRTYSIGHYVTDELFQPLDSDSPGQIASLAAAAASIQERANELNQLIGSYCAQNVTLDYYSSRMQLVVRNSEAGHKKIRQLLDTLEMPLEETLALDVYRFPDKLDLLEIDKPLREKFENLIHGWTSTYPNLSRQQFEELKDLYRKLQKVYPQDLRIDEPTRWTFGPGQPRTVPISMDGSRGTITMRRDPSSLQLQLRLDIDYAGTEPTTSQWFTLGDGPLVISDAKEAFFLMPVASQTSAPKTSTPAANTKVQEATQLGGPVETYPKAYPIGHISSGVLFDAVAQHSSTAASLKQNLESMRFSAEELERLLKSQLVNSIATITYYPDRQSLLIRDTAEGHRQIEELLAALRVPTEREHNFRLQLLSADFVDDETKKLPPELRGKLQKEFQPIGKSSVISVEKLTELKELISEAHRAEPDYFDVFAPIDITLVPGVPAAFHYVNATYVLTARIDPASGQLQVRCDISEPDREVWSTVLSFDDSSDGRVLYESACFLMPIKK